MRDDLPEAAIRLASSLPVRTHEQRNPDGRKIKRGDRNAGRGAEGLPIRVDGVEYHSIKEARRKLKKGAKTIQRWLDLGQAEYI